MRRSALERRLTEELRSAPLPGAADAEARGWRVVRAAYAAPLAVSPPRRRPRMLLAGVVAAVAAALALSPAGAALGDLVSDVVSPPLELDSLPAEGRLLVVSKGGPEILADDGSRRALGDWPEVSWSAGGRFVVAARGNKLVALDLKGEPRWTRPTPGPVSLPRWSPDGFRIAYRSGDDLWVSAGDDSNRWLIARGVAAVAAAWKPGQPAGQQVLAYASGRRVRIVEANGGAELGATPAGPPPQALWWAGHTLLAVGRLDVRLHDGQGRLLRTLALPEGLELSGSAMSPDGRRLALAAQRPGGASSELLVFRIDRPVPPRSVYAGRGPIDGLTWSVDSRVLLAGLPQADQWLFLRPPGSLPVRVESRIREEFDATGRGDPFPRPAGWCLADPPAPDAASFIACSGAAQPR